MNSLNTYIDHTLLKATATEQDIINLCNEAKKFSNLNFLTKKQ